MTVDLTALKGALANQGTKLDKAISLLNTIPGLIAQIKSTDPETQAEIDALVTDVTTHTSELADALAADTPVEDAPATDA